MALICDVDSLLDSSRCFTEPCISEEERDAIDIYVRMQALVAAGGTNYLNDLTQLQIDAKQWQTIFKNQRDAMELYMDIQGAISNGASFSTAINDLKAASKCILCLGEEQKKRLKSFLKCAVFALGEPD